MRLGQGFPAESRIIEIGAVDGALAESLRAAGYAKHLLVVRDERRRRAIVNARPEVADHIAISASRRVVQQNNADVLVLHGWLALFAWRWRNIRHARFVALPWTGSPLCWFAALIWFCQWLLGRLAWPHIVRPKRVANATHFRSTARATLLVFRVRRPRPHTGARHFIPHAQGVENFLRGLDANGIRHAVLRWFERLPQLPAGEDIDLLVDDEGLAAVHALLDAAPGIQPIDVYSVTGLPGADFRAMPYFPPFLAEELLDRAVCQRQLCWVPAPREHFLSLAYHALYHKGAASGIPSRAGRNGQRQTDHDYAGVLARLARQLGIKISITLEDLDEHLDSQGWRPPHDMLVRLSRRNRWVRSLLRRPEKGPATDDGLAVFLIRQEALRRGGVERAANLIKSYGFEILSTRMIDEDDSSLVARSIRGGNWGRGPWPASGGPPVAAIIAYDKSPTAPTRRQRRRYPFVANARLLCKDKLRDAFNEGVSVEQHCNVVHSSDNGREAIDYLRIIMPQEIENVLNAIRLSGRETRRAA
jgi:hypothetical protein